MKAKGVLVFAGGLVEELDQAFSADDTSGTLTFTDGPFAESKEWLGGFTVIDVETEEQARDWGGRVAEGCGWPAGGPSDRERLHARLTLGRRSRSLEV